MKKEIRVADPNDPRNKEATSSDELVWEVEEEDAEYAKHFIGRIPIMLKSFYCHLNSQGEKDLFAMGECPYDQVCFFPLQFKRSFGLLKSNALSPKISNINEKI
jgi:hypothetical protein